MDGVSRISELADRIGLMARDPRDIISLANILLADESTAIQDKIRLDDLWEGLSIGILDSEWGTDPSSAWKWSSKEVVRIRRKERLSMAVHHTMHSEVPKTLADFYTDRKICRCSPKARDFGCQSHLPAGRSSSTKRDGIQWREIAQRILSVPNPDSLRPLPINVIWLTLLKSRFRVCQRAQEFHNHQF